MSKIKIAGAVSRDHQFRTGGSRHDRSPTNLRHPERRRFRDLRPDLERGVGASRHWRRAGHAQVAKVLGPEDRAMTRPSSFKLRAALVAGLVVLAVASVAGCQLRQFRQPYHEPAVRPLILR
ncbi:hypothetical protein [Caulobacter sp. LjRoot300]|uniref:hypothetical protein n=1 Tax=Caulobacter sp. LjRoot300 TaxID=3342321 RepID=UPI003ECD29AC